jgi:tetratricopeptide (TPR) repeat protein
VDINILLMFQSSGRRRYRHLFLGDASTIKSGDKVINTNSALANRCRRQIILRQFAYSFRVTGKSQRPFGGPIMLAVVRSTLVLVLITVGASASAESNHSAVESLMDKTADLNVTIDRFTQSIDCDALQRLEVYFGTESANLTPVEISFRIDDQMELHQSFNDFEQASFTKGGLYKFSCLKLTPGSHHVHAEIGVQDTAAIAGTHLYRLSYDATLEKSPQLLTIEILVHRRVFLSEPEIYLRGADFIRTSATQNSSSLLPGQRTHITSHQTSDRISPFELDIGYARYLSADQKPFSALTLLRRLAVDHSEFSFELERELASNAIDLGMLQIAASTTKRLIEAGAPKSVILSLQLQLALSFYKSGELERADDELIDIGRSIPKTHLNIWQDIYSRVLLAEGKFDKASNLLIHTENNADYESLVNYYNLGIALIKTNRAGQGITVLNRVGEISSDDLLLARLRDKANLTLGYYFLAQLQGATAILIFERVSRDGPMSSQALLGLGWARLAPTGSQQEQEAIGDERTVGPPPESIIGPKIGSADQNLYQRYDLRPFERVNTSNDVKTRLQQALIPWSELEKRDSGDPAVYEGMLAIAMAFEQLGAHKNARDEYEKALSLLDENECKLDSAINYVNNEQWIDPLLGANAGEEPSANWVVADLPRSQFAVFLESLIAGNEFQQTIREYRELLLLEQFLRKKATELKMPERNGKSSGDDQQERLLEQIDLLVSEVNAEQDAQRKHAVTLAGEKLQSLQFRNHQLLDAVHFSLARVYDRRPVQ